MAEFGDRLCPWYHNFLKSKKAHLIFFRWVLKGLLLPWSSATGPKSLEFGF